MKSVGVGEEHISIYIVSGIVLMPMKNILLIQFHLFQPIHRSPSLPAFHSKRYEPEDNRIVDGIVASWHVGTRPAAAVAVLEQRTRPGRSLSLPPCCCCQPYIEWLP